MLLLRGVTPVQVERMPDRASLVSVADGLVRQHGWAEDGETIVVVARDDEVDSGARIIVHRMGEGGF